MTAEPTDAEVEAVFRILRNFRLSNMADDEGDAYPLVDAMTADGCSIADGIEQMQSLAYDIAEAARRSADARVAAAVKDALEHVAAPFSLYADQEANSDFAKFCRDMSAVIRRHTVPHADHLATLLAEAKRRGMERMREECLRIAIEFGRAALDTQKSTARHSSAGQCYDYETLAGRYYAGAARGACEKANDIATAIRALPTEPDARSVPGDRAWPTQ